MILDEIKDVIVDATVYEDVTIHKYEIPLIAVAMNGFYVVLDTTDDKIIDTAIKDISELTGVRANQLFVFATDSLYGENEAGVFYSYVNGISEFDDIVRAFSNCYTNHLLPQVELQKADISTPEEFCYDLNIAVDCDEALYVAPVLSVADMKRYIEKLESLSYEPDTDGKYKINPDGSMETKRDVQERIGPFKSFISGHSAYFPCMDVDGDTFFLIALFGGLFGLHHYKTGHIFRGLFYTLTFGCCGVFYILDLIQIATGTFNYKSVVPSCDDKNKYQRVRFFCRPMQNKKFALITIPIAVVVSALIIYFCYIPLLQIVTAAVSDLLAGTQWAQDTGAQMGLTE